MTLSTPDTVRLLVALVALLIAAHGTGYIFRWLRQPPVIGEILGGLLLGPTLFGRLLPGWYEAVFAPGSPTPVVLGAVYQLGLLLLMFCSGLEIRASFREGEMRSVSAITASGTLLPFAAGVVAVRFVDFSAEIGPAGSETAFLLVFAIAVAVTSIPVISRILYDLKVLETPFARIVLSTAVIEDVVLYVVLAIALSIAGGVGEEGFGLPRMLHLEGGSAASLVYHVAITVLFLGAALRLGRRVFRLLDRLRFNLLRRSSPVAHLLAVLLVMTSVAAFLGIAPMFGAFVAGIVTSRSTEERERPREAIKSFSFAFFIPIYFAIVGLRLDLVGGFDPVGFLLFLVFACVVKTAGVYLGASLAGEGRAGALNLAVALNARGGPGIVLASLAFDAGIIVETFYATLVMLSVVTSLAAGSWLDFVLRRGWPLR